MASRRRWRRRRSSQAMKKNRKVAKKRPKGRTRSRPRSTVRPKRADRPSSAPELGSATSELLRELSEHHGVSPIDSGGDVDADWQRAQSSGEEAVGGSVATPDQDVLSELAPPLGVARAPQAETMHSHGIRGREGPRTRRKSA